MLTQMLQPNLYHGKTFWNRFEGWYFKLVTQDGQEAISFIPGIFWGRNKQSQHAFLQVLDSPRLSYTYHQFPAKDFLPSPKKFQIQIHNNSFSLAGIQLEVTQAVQSIKGQVRFSDLISWPDNRFSPGSMGPFNFFPFLECYSQVCALSMSLQGRIQINNQEYVFDGGTGYVEKNWGSAFPQSWIWVQSNHFSQPHISLSCSIARIPVWVTHFTGFLAGLYFQGVFYPFTTMNGSSVRISPHQDDVEILLLNQHHQLTLITKSHPESFMLCRAPEKKGIMKPLVAETLHARVVLELKERASGKVLLQDEGWSTGVEYGGNYKELFH